MNTKTEQAITTELCRQCGGHCCKHIALPIEKPTSKTDFDHIRWYLMHQNVNVFIDLDNDWMIEFRTPCKNLNNDFQCEKYSERPHICRKFPGPDVICEYVSDSPAYKIMFTCTEELEEYLDKKKINWRFKS